MNTSRNIGHQICMSCIFFFCLSLPMTVCLRTCFTDKRYFFKQKFESVYQRKLCCTFCSNLKFLWSVTYMLLKKHQQSMFLFSSLHFFVLLCIELVNVHLPNSKRLKLQFINKFDNSQNPQVFLHCLTAGSLRHFSQYFFNASDSLVPPVFMIIL